MRPYLCVYGHTNLDYILCLKQFPEKNTSVNVEEKRTYYGGTGANVATIASSLGVPTALCSFVGGDLPQGFRRQMSDVGVDLRDLVTVDGNETPTVWIVSDSKHDQIAYVYQGPMGRMEEFEPRTEAAMESDWVHIMTGRPDYYLNVMEACSKAGKLIGFDPAQEIHHVWDARRFKKAISKATAFFCNENEMRTALRYLKLDRPEQLLGQVEMVVNTLGSRGSRIITREDTMDMPAVKPEKVVDTTGAGDAFRAGLYAGRFRGYDLRKSAIVGAAAASYVIEARGSLTNVPTWSQVEARAKPLF